MSFIIDNSSIANRTIFDDLENIISNICFATLYNKKIIIKNNCCTFLKNNIERNPNINNLITYKTVAKGIKTITIKKQRGLFKLPIELNTDDSPLVNDNVKLKFEYPIYPDTLLLNDKFDEYHITLDILSSLFTYEKSKYIYNIVIEIMNDVSFYKNIINSLINLQFIEKTTKKIIYHLIINSSIENRTHDSESETLNYFTPLVI